MGSRHGGELSGWELSSGELSCYDLVHLIGNVIVWPAEGP